MPAILSVSELTRAVKDLLEAEFPFVWVRGQISNLARPASGHIYFSLTDGDAVLGTVWFRGAQRASEPQARGDETINPLTGEIEESVGPALNQRLEDGMEVLCAGRLNVFEPRGQYQLVAELVQEQGVGDLRMAFEALKKKLSDKGYFDEARKMAVPSNPARVAVVTSPHGAAIRDFLRLSEVRGTGSEIRIYPTLVQGDRAPEQIAQALDMVSEEQWAEVAVLIRGGGSLEDLWAFNTEPVADAIFRSQIPVVCGVGHEPDVSIADFVADHRVATPSHAAQELWPRRETLSQQVDRLEIALARAYHSMLRDREADFSQLRRALVLLSPERRLAQQAETFHSLAERLQSAANRMVRDNVDRTVSLTRRLVRAHGVEAINQKGRTVQSLGHGLQVAMERLLERSSAGFETAAASLNALNPERPLEQGYGLVRVRKNGKFLRSPDEVTPGDVLDIRVRDGSVLARVMNEAEENK